jgi:hypothetical protein
MLVFVLFKWEIIICCDLICYCFMISPYMNIELSYPHSHMSQREQTLRRVHTQRELHVSGAKSMSPARRRIHVNARHLIEWWRRYSEEIHMLGLPLSSKVKLANSPIVVLVLLVPTPLIPATVASHIIYTKLICLHITYFIILPT